MNSINKSVGRGGRNHSEDVKKVQKLLNEHRLPPLSTLEIDGIVGPATIKTIEHFQEVKVEMRYPDGRVDPGGKTFRKLRDIPGGNEPSPPKNESRSINENQENRKERRKFVRGPVKEIPITTDIINAIQPDFKNVRATVISGYLNDSDLFWKVNYHWEYLLWMVEHALTLEVSSLNKKKLQGIRSSLLSAKPDPETGYRESGAVGKPEDKSSAAEADRRYEILRQNKKAFKQIFEREELKSKSRRDERTFDLAVAPVARPGKSKHKSGYALDIEGDNVTIKSTCKRRGASLTFDEKSHVHVEFARGVQQST